MICIRNNYFQITSFLKLKYYNVPKIYLTTVVKKKDLLKLFLKINMLKKDKVTSIYTWLRNKYCIASLIVSF